MSDKSKEPIPHPNLRHLVGFCIFMQQNEGILGKHPDYLMEKFEMCRTTGVPEGMMDEPNMFIMAEYAKRYQLDWVPQRDYNNVPKGAFSIRGEPTTIFPEED